MPNISTWMIIKTMYAAVPGVLSTSYKVDKNVSWFTGMSIGVWIYQKQTHGTFRFSDHINPTPFLFSNALLTVTVQSTLACWKTCVVGLLIRSILRGKIARALQREFFQRKIELTDQQDMFYFNHSSAFYTSNSILKMLINNEFKAHTSTGNSTGNSRCYVLASRVLNMSCSFDQSAHSIESRYVIEWVTLTRHRLCYEHDDVIKWKHFPRYWPFVRGIHWSRWIPRSKASDAELWCFLWLRLNKDWVNNREAGDLRCYHGHYDVIVMRAQQIPCMLTVRTLLWFVVVCFTLHFRFIGTGAIMCDIALKYTGK